MTKPRRFRLDIVGEYEDRPRLLRAYGRVRGSELTVVLRPTEQRAVFVVLGKEGCTLWKLELEPGEKRFVESSSSASAPRSRSSIGRSRSPVNSSPAW